jgi:murein DD-endopeptidase MepM/ murein hydrolase activator NlpD
MKLITFVILVVTMLCSCATDVVSSSASVAVTIDTVPQPKIVTPTPYLAEQMVGLFTQSPEFIAKGFDYPVGKPDARGYYNAQGFEGTTHLGDDWNAVTGGNSDLGDPIYAIANGYVNFAEDINGGWGNVIRLWHRTADSINVESLYAHCDTILVRVGDFVEKGQQIGTIGDAHGSYLAHLHLEIREDLELPIGGGYSSDKTGYLDPTAFIKAHR